MKNEVPTQENDCLNSLSGFVLVPCLPDRQASDL
jgi:hypothetical protein